MKTRLNILSILILALFVYAIGYDLYKGSVDFRQGFRAGFEHKNPDHISKKLGEKHSLQLMLNTEQDIPIDSIYNIKTGKYYPVEYSSIEVYSQQEERFFIKLITASIGIFGLILLPLLFICFYRTISAIKSGRIFYRGNVVKLRLMGLCFCALAFLECVYAYCHLSDAREFYGFNGYSIMSGQWFASSFWIYGLISFLVAEIFAFGLKLKEEQDLTI